MSHDVRCLISVLRRVEKLEGLKRQTGARREHHWEAFSGMKQIHTSDRAEQIIPISRSMYFGADVSLNDMIGKLYVDQILRFGSV